MESLKGRSIYFISLVFILKCFTKPFIVRHYNALIINDSNFSLLPVLCEHVAVLIQVTYLFWIGKMNKLNQNNLVFFGLLQMLKMNKAFIRTKNVFALNP